MKMHLKWKLPAMLAIAGMSMGVVLCANARGQNSYRQINLVSDQEGAARFQDPNLVNPWGLLAAPGGRLIVADNHAAVATLYSAGGHPANVVLNVPAPDGGPGGAVTDLALNPFSRSFVVSKDNRSGGSVLLFGTEDGTISGWNANVDAKNAVVAVDNSGAGAIYKSIALANTAQGPMLFAANFGQGDVEIYDRAFHPVKAFTDDALAGAGFVPFGLRVIGVHLFVTYAFKASPQDDDETAGPGLGYVDEYDLQGNLVRQFAGQGTLNAPWGIALAPRGFGKFAGALLVGNFGDGAINSYDPQTGNFLGQLTDEAGNVIQIDGLWGLSFRGGLLYFTAGPDDENHGLLGVLRAQGSGRM